LRKSAKHLASSCCTPSLVDMHCCNIVEDDDMIHRRGNEIASSEILSRSGQAAWRLSQNSTRVYTRYQIQFMDQSNVAILMRMIMDRGHKDTFCFQEGSKEKKEVCFLWSANHIHLCRTEQNYFLNTGFLLPVFPVHQPDRILP
jgi:hypothetical protein